MTECKFIGKSVYFPEEKVLAIGDMHLGHEFTYRSPGSQIPATQVQETKKDLEKIFKQLKKENKKIEKIVFLGDIKHFFSYERGEKNIILEILLMVGEHIDRDNIILIKGNHEKMANIADKKLQESFTKGNLTFIHGDEELEEAFSDKINTIVMGHLHPAVVISDEQKVKKEKYKCFLIGKYKRKNIIILPSFLPTYEGISTNEYLTDNHCFIPKNKLMTFNVHAIGDNEVLDFGILKDL
jgi:putative SbcD/Mre11-related phosphoesterase